MRARVRRLRLLPLAAGVLLVACAVDFTLFVRSAAALAPPANARADAVVSLTGGSDKRIRTGVELVAAGAGRRLLISGVHPETTMAEIINEAQGEQAVYDCCVDLGLKARSTVGNGAEAAEWAASNNYKSLLVVTADFHMPRSLIELRHAMPERELIAYPVRSGVDPGKPFSSWRTFRNLLVEWAKWRVTQVRRGLF